MQSNNADGIVQLLTGLFGFFGMALFFIGFIAYAVWQTKKRKRLQNQLMANAQASGADGTQSFAVKYASGKMFKSIIKVFPWEASGLLQLTNQGVLFQGAKDNGQPINLVFEPSQTKASWVGRNFINGATAWFLLEQNGEKHYFTVETGTTVFGTKGGSKQILEAVTAHLNNLQNFGSQMKINN